jgi:hypothetical protein
VVVEVGVSFVALPLTENAVVDAVCLFVQEAGWVIEQKLTTHGSLPALDIGLFWVETSLCVRLEASWRL